MTGRPTRPARRGALAAGALAALLALGAFGPAGCTCGIGWGGTFCVAATRPARPAAAPWVLAPTREEPRRLCRTDRSECRPLDAAIRRELEAPRSLLP